MARRPPHRLIRDLQMWAEREEAAIWRRRGPGTARKQREIAKRLLQALGASSMTTCRIIVTVGDLVARHRHGMSTKYREALRESLVCILLEDTGSDVERRLPDARWKMKGQADA